MSKSSRWTNEEIENLRSSNGIREMKEKIPNKTVAQIRSKAGKMKISVAENKWSDEEIDFLLNNYEKLGAKTVSEKIGKKRSEVSHKAKVMKLKFIPAHEKIDIDNVIEMYVDQNKSMQTIADYYGVHKDYIRRIIPKQYKNYRLSIDSKELVEKYKSGIGTTLLAKEYKTYPGVIRDMLMRNGIVLRDLNEASKATRIDLPIRQIIDLYCYGFSMRDIGSMFEVSPLTIKNRLEEEGVNIREDISFYTRGYKSGSWKGGVTPKNQIIRESADYRKWRELVFKRDNYTCQCCGDTSGGNLEAHHILNFSEHQKVRFETSNGITMCDICHNPNQIGSFHHTYGTRENDIQQLQEYFDDIRAHLGLPLVKIKNIIYQDIKKIS